MEPQQLFINSSGRLRSGWRLIIFILVFIAALFVLSALGRAAYAIFIYLAPNSSPGYFIEDLVFRSIFLIATLLASFSCARWLEGLPWRAVGIAPHSGWLRDFLFGSIVGIASLALAVGIAALGGGLKFSFSPGAGMLLVGQTLIFSAVIFIIAALAEEALFRGYPLQTLSRAGLFWLGTLITSVAFASIHLDNPNLESSLPLLNLVLAGVWFALAFFKTRSLWFPLGLHWAWNWALGSLFGLPVSGITRIAPHPLLQGTDLGPMWLTGGEYGVEGGLAGTVALIVSTIFVWRTKSISATEDMKRLSSVENPVVSETSPLLDKNGVKGID